MRPDYGDLVCVEHDVGVAVLVLPLLDDLLVDEVPLRHGPAVLADILAQLGDRVVLARVVAAGRAVVLGRKNNDLLEFSNAFGEPGNV